MTQRQPDGHRATEWWFILLAGLLSSAVGVASAVRALPIPAAAACFGSAVLYFLAGILYTRRLIELNRVSRIKSFRDPDAE